MTEVSAVTTVHLDEKDDRVSGTEWCRASAHDASPRQADSSDENY
jgi:hypothetical protein